MRSILCARLKSFSALCSDRVRRQHWWLRYQVRKSLCTYARGLHTHVRGCSPQGARQRRQGVRQQCTRQYTHLTLMCARLAWKYAMCALLTVLSGMCATSCKWFTNARLWHEKKIGIHFCTKRAPAHLWYGNVNKLGIGIGNYIFALGESPHRVED